MATKAKAKPKAKSSTPKTKTPKGQRRTPKVTDSVFPVQDVTARSDDDALVGHFVDVVDGDHKGRYGVLDSTSEPDADGYPSRGTVITRDQHNETINVKYADLRRAEAGRR